MGEALGWFVALVMLLLAIWIARTAVSKDWVLELLACVKESGPGRKWTEADWNQVMKSVRKRMDDWSVFRDWYKKEIVKGRRED